MSVLRAERVDWQACWGQSRADGLVSSCVTPRSVIQPPQQWNHNLICLKLIPGPRIKLPLRSRAPQAHRWLREGGYCLLEPDAGLSSPHLCRSCYKMVGLEKRRKKKRRCNGEKCCHGNAWLPSSLRCSVSPFSSALSACLHPCLCPAARSALTQSLHFWNI